MNTEILSLIIASCVSVLVACISYYTNRSSVKAAQKKFQKEQQRRLTEKLYEKRMEMYPKGFDITDELRNDLLWKIRPTSKYLESVRKNLISWYSSEAGFFLSKKALKSYYNLRDVLMRKPKSGTSFSKEELQKVWDAKNNFRKILREDVDLLYAEEHIETESTKKS